MESNDRSPTTGGQAAGSRLQPFQGGGRVSVVQLTSTRWPHSNPRAPNHFREPTVDAPLRLRGCGAKEQRNEQARPTQKGRAHTSAHTKKRIHSTHCSPYFFEPSVWVPERDHVGDKQVFYVCKYKYPHLQCAARVAPLPSKRRGGQGSIRTGGGGVWDQKVCAPKMARPDFPFCKFRFFPRWSLGSGEGWEGGTPPLPMVYGRAPVPRGSDSCRCVRWMCSVPSTLWVLCCVCRVCSAKRAAGGDAEGCGTQDAGEDQDPG